MPLAKPLQNAWSRSIFTMLENVPPPLVAVISMLLGVSLLGASILAHVNTVVFPGSGKVLGYFYEINWSLNYVVAIPVALYFCASAMNGIRHVISELAKNKMIVNSEGIPRKPDFLIESWHRTLGWFLLVGAILSIIGLLYSWREWRLNFAYEPSWTPNTLAQQTDLLLGWNLAPLGHHGRYYPEARRFGFFAFTAQGIVVAFYLLFISTIYAFATWIYRFTTDSTKDELVPDSKSPDPRKGFEKFEPLIETLLFAALAFFLVFFLTRLDNEFVASDSPTLPDFIKSDIWFGFTKGIQGLFKGQSDLFYAGKKLTDAIAMVGAGLGVAIVTVFLFPAVIVRQAAISSRDRATHPPEGMVFWPLKYPKPIQLLLLIVLASACFVFYRLTLVIVGVAIALAVKEVYAILGAKPVKGSHGD